MTDTNNQPDISTTDASVSSEQYSRLVNDMLQELNQVLDEYVVVRAARKVAGLKLSDKGEVESIEGDPQAAVQGLVNEIIGLSNAVVVKTLQPLLKQCPWIKVPMTEK